MEDELLLMIPGPTILPPEIREALARPSLYHRSEAFAELLAECTAGLQTLFGTAEPVLILTSSGTGAVEAMIVNLLAPGDRVLVIRSGKFGERLAEIATAYGMDVVAYDVPWGEATPPEQIHEQLRRQSYRALLFVYNETSTGVKQELHGLAAVAAEGGVWTLVDCVSAIAGMPIEFDVARLTAAAAGSQKALMLPPGLAFVCLSAEAWEAAERVATPRYYFDLRKAREAFAKGQTPYTPNVNLIVALRESLRLIEREGLAQFQQRHQRLARACRAAARAAGLELLAAEPCASAVVTAIRAPAGLDSRALVRAVRERHKIVISGGQGALQGKIFRIAHMGAAQLSDLLRTWEALTEELKALGCACDKEAVLTALEDAYWGLAANETSAAGEIDCG